MRTLAWLIENGCELQRPSIPMLTHIYNISGGDPCRECNCKPTCPAWVKILLEPNPSVCTVVTYPPKETNAMVAKRLGITKRQAAKMRQRERLNEIFR